MPRRRRGARAASVEAAERSLAMRVMLHSPKDTLAAAAAFAVVTAIIVNALFLQAGRHPAPMFGSITTLPAVASPSVNPLPRSRPLEADTSQPESRFAETRPADTLAVPVKTAGTASVASTVVSRPPAAIPVVSHGDLASGGSRRVAAVQRALTEYGYGQLKPTGVAGTDTQAAIQKFERARKLPVTGQVSDRLVRELTAMIGYPIDQ